MHATQVPQQSELQQELATAYFYDAYAVPLEWEGRTALQIYLDVISRTPAWMDALMAARNRIVAPFGLKDIGRFTSIDPERKAATYRIGDRAGIFSILSLSDGEVVLGDFDKHLKARISIYRDLTADGSPRVTVSTVVHINNFLGRAYLFFVVPVHQFLVPAMLSRAMR
ncbi:DUF2867 domain-containing protein [Undibacterium sp. TJN25]|uniref:DUF2867 domain-containing protein n=1 Tax=Undibacterium sp. TJN25 TaxID=3413056 RepID=UPI003BF1D3D3